MNESQALSLIDAHEVIQLLNNAEEVLLLKHHNPELLDAYHALLSVAGLGVGRE